MFNLDNIEFDFDEDFSSNVFSKKVPSDGKGNAEKEKEKVKPNQNVSKSSVCQSFKQFGEHPKQERCIGSSDLLNLPFSGEKSLKRPHKEVEKPQKKRLSHEGLLQRRFPGPAGLLPDKPIKEISEVPLPLEKACEEEENEKEKPLIYSQCSGSVFLGSGYQKLVNDFSLNESDNPLNRYTVEWVKKTALNKGLQGRKIPFLGLVVHTVSHSVPDPVLVLRDPTGEISGSLHREVWAEMGGKLKTGIALALRQVGVLITGVMRRQIYLNITMNNILAIYSPSENESEVETTTVNGASKSELLKSFAEWSAPTRVAPAHAPPPQSFPFTTIDAKFDDARSAKSKQREILDDLGISFSESDFSEEIGIPRSDQDRSANGKRTSNQTLSPAESQIFEEVLSGINLDEFEM